MKLPEFLTGRAGRKPLPVTPAQLNNAFDRRVFVIGSLQLGVGVLLAARLGYLTVAENSKYAAAAESNRVNLTLIPPRRGAILDRNGAALAANRAAFRVDVVPERLIEPEKTLATLADLLALPPEKLQDVKDKLEKAHGFQPVEVASDIDFDKFAAVSLRAPELPGVVPQRGYSRSYPTGSSVAHLIGYVGPATAEDYEREKNPLMITPGFKIGKDGLEKHFETQLRGVPGARRVVATASGRIVKDLGTREDVPGGTLQLTINGPLQDYAARRAFQPDAAVTVIDCHTGEILALVSMPAFDPNRFVGGIGRIEWKMLNEDDHIPLLNKALRGLYPPGSTMKPMATLALQQHGVSPDERVNCSGGFRLGSRFFRCDAVHGSMDMRSAIEHSCNSYFWTMANRVGYDAIAPTAKLLGLGQQFDLPLSAQRYGTIPDAAWKMKRYKQAWTGADSLNASIGQGYVSVSPLQLAVMASRVASGRNLQPWILHGHPKAPGPALPFTPEQLMVAHDGMFRVVNGAGTAVASKLNLGDIRMAGKTGTAQVRALVARGGGGAWKFRDHSLFVCYAPADAPRYAMSVVVEHGTQGARAAAPIARDCMTFLFDPGKAMDTLRTMEKGWGGTPTERMEARYRAYAAQYGTTAPKVGDDQAVEDAIDEADKAGDPTEVEKASGNAREPNETPAPPPESADTPAPAAAPSVAPPAAANAPAIAVKPAPLP
jgi:penicillin-binding protein 2